MGGGKNEYGRAVQGGQEAAYNMSNIANQLYSQTSPLRASFMDEYNKMARGEMPFDTVGSSLLSAARPAIEAQYNVAKENILGTSPTGGRLLESLADVETAKANTLGNISANYLMDILNKGYGAAWQTPQLSIGGLGNVMQYGTGAMNAAEQGAQARAQAMGMCCFNFLEAEGEIYYTVRRYRDAHYSKTGHISKGYKYMAYYLVPLMKRSVWGKNLVRVSMTRPLKCYSQWYYGENHWGFILWPFKVFWTGIWGILGMGVK